MSRGDTVDGEVVLHHESQGLLSQPLAAVGLGVGAGAVVVAAVLDTPTDVPGWLALGIGLAVLGWVATMRLEFVLTASRLRVQLSFLRFAVDMAAIRTVEVVEYRPLRQFGGWGWRWGRHGSRQFAMSGARAVLVTLEDERTVYLGGDDPVGLAEAIDRARAATS